MVHRVRELFVSEGSLRRDNRRLGAMALPYMAIDQVVRRVE